MLQFGFYRVGLPYTIGGTAENKAFIDWWFRGNFLAINADEYRGMNGQKLLIASAHGAAYLFLRHPILTGGERYVPDTRCRRTRYSENWFRISDAGIRSFFLSRHDVCVCRTGGRPMIAGRARNPAIFASVAVSAAVIVGIYMVGTQRALNTLCRRENRHYWRGVMQAMHAADTLHMPWLIPVMAIMFWLSGRLTRLVGPIYMLRKPRVKIICWGTTNRQVHPVWKHTLNAFALTVQAIIVTVLCFHDFISPSVAAKHWMLTA